MITYIERIEIYMLNLIQQCYLETDHRLNLVHNSEKKAQGDLPMKGETTKVHIGTFLKKKHTQKSEQKKHNKNGQKHNKKGQKKIGELWEDQSSQSDIKK